MLIFIFEIIGTVVFAISGAMVAINKKMDLFGVIILGGVTAVGGGIIRDIILGNTPPTTFLEPVYALISMVVSIMVFMPFSVKFKKKSHTLFNNILIIMDALGLGIFTVMGLQTAYECYPETSVFLSVFVGVVTGVGGGVLRDIMAGEQPYIFVKHFYATAALIGAVVCAVLRKYIGDYLACVIGAALIVTLRLLAARFRWKLPKYKD